MAIQETDTQIFIYPGREDAINDLLSQAEATLDTTHRFRGIGLGGVIGLLSPFPVLIGLGAFTGGIVELAKDHLDLEQIAADLEPLLRSSSYTVLPDLNLNGSLSE